MIINGDLWFGTQASFAVLAKYQEQFYLDKEAFSPSRYAPEENRTNLDPVFGVDEDRIGLGLLEMVGDTAVVKVRGSLTPNYARWHSWFPNEATSYEALKDALHIAAEHEGAKTILMDMASGGGAVRGLDQVTETIRRVSAVKQVNAHTDSHAMSAAYWIMVSAKNVTGSRMAEVGSIGTIMVVATYANTEENMGVKFTVLREGEYKALGNPHEELSEKAKAELQRGLADANAFFLEHVSINRNLMLSEKSIWAEGKTFYARKAVEVGLLDRIVNLDDLIGSGASAQETGLQRSYEMPISPEKRAQIEAGANPKDVLTAEELKQWNTELEAAAAAAAAEKPEPTAEEIAAAAAAAEKPEATADTGKPAVVATDALTDALKANGRLEAQLEAATAKVADLTAQLALASESVTSAKAETASLMVVGQEAVRRLQVATGSPLEAKATVAEVVTQFTTLQSRMAGLFKTGQQSADVPVADETVKSGLQGFRAANLNQAK